MNATQYPPDFFSDANVGPSAFAADVVTRVIGFTAIALRFISRRIAGAKFWWDDYLILASIPLSITGLGIEINLVELGIGRHLGWIMQNQSQEQIVQIAKLTYADEWLYAPIVGVIKLSTLALYIRIFGVNKNMRYACYIQMALVCVWAIITEFLFIFQCTPIWVAWDPTRQGGSCFSFTGLFIGTNTVNVFMDLLILITPLRSIWTLNLPITKRLLINVVLALGAATLALSILRLVELGVLTFQDDTYDYGLALLFSTLEPNIGIVCVCMPVMGPLLAKIFPKLKLHTPHNSASKHPSRKYGNSSRNTRNGENSSGFDEERELVAYSGGNFSANPSNVSQTTAIS